jgi:hypothetical protein
MQRSIPDPRAGGVRDRANRARPEEHLPNGAGSHTRWCDRALGLPLEYAKSVNPACPEPCHFRVEICLPWPWRELYSGRCSMGRASCFHAVASQSILGGCESGGQNQQPGCQKDEVSHTTLGHQRRPGCCLVNECNGISHQLGWFRLHSDERNLCHWCWRAWLGLIRCLLSP